MDSGGLSSITLKKGEQTWSYALAIVGLMVLGGLGYGLFLLLPFLILLAKNTIIFVAELAVLIAMLVTLAGIWSERDTWIYKWKNFVRRFRRAIVREDPIGVLETAIRRFNDRLETIEEKINETVGALKIQKAKQKEAQFKAEEAAAMYLAAKNKGVSEQEQTRYALSNDRWTKTANGMQPMIDLLTQAKGSFEQARDIAVNTMKDFEDQKQNLKVQFEASKAGQSAVKAFKAFFGKTDDSDWAQMALDELETTINTNEAEIEQFMRVMDPVLKEDQMRNQAQAVAAMNRLSGIAQNQKQLPSPKAVEVISVEKVKSPSLVDHN